MTPAAADLAAGIQASWARHLERDARPSAPHGYVYASAWRVCERRMVLDLTHADQVPAWSADALARFRRGNDRERDLLADLERVGRDADPPFRLIGQQERFTLRDRRGRTAIVGKVDARVEIAGVRAPVEVKAWSPNIVDRIESFDDLFANVWTRAGGFQLLSYLFGANEPLGFLVLDRSGLPLLLPVELESHLDRMEDFLARAERALDHVDAGTLPPYLEGDAAECRRCSHYGISCQPPISSAAAVLLDDPALEAALTRRDELLAAGREFEALDTDIKKRVRGVEHGIVGQFELVGTWGKSSRVELPADLKKQFTVTDPHGRFTLDIVRHVQ